jgi:N-acetyl-anhydromuramyl-L-alanine amidase AmpD
MKTVNKFLPEHCYTRENTIKKRICLHHTVSSPLSVDGDIATWAATRSVATAYIIGGDGTVFKMIPENYWAHHLGTKRADNTQLNKETIGIEIDAWGPLAFKDGKYFNFYGKEHDKNLAVEKLSKPFRGHLYYQEYLDAQIDALQILLYKLSIEHKIPLEGLNKTLDFELFADFSGAGLYSHTNFRADKSDVYPARRLVSMLKMLVV